MVGQLGGGTVSITDVRETSDGYLGLQGKGAFNANTYLPLAMAYRSSYITFGLRVDISAKANGGCPDLIVHVPLYRKAEIRSTGHRRCRS
jgi:hypothetical protein